jgi:hypothetical protein
MRRLAKPQRSRLALKTIFGLILGLTLAGAFAVGSQARTANTSPRYGALHATKRCGPPDMVGQAGGFCTFTGSNLRQIPAGSKVFYLEPAGAAGLDTDVVLYAGPGNAALGHVVLSSATRSGSVILNGGSGVFRGFRARVLVTFNPAENLWHWDGTYRYGRRKG